MTRILIIGGIRWISIGSIPSWEWPPSFSFTRRKNVVQTLATREIILVIGSASESGTYLGVVQINRFEVVIDASSAKQDSRKVFSDVRSLSEKRVQQDGTAPKVGYIYVSGMWVHGHAARRMVSDTDPVGTEDAAVAPVYLVGMEDRLGT